MDTCDFFFWLFSSVLLPLPTRRRATLFPEQYATGRPANRSSQQTSGSSGHRGEPSRMQTDTSPSRLTPVSIASYAPCSVTRPILSLSRERPTHSAKCAWSPRLSCFRKSLFHRKIRQSRSSGGPSPTSNDGSTGFIPTKCRPSRGRRFFAIPRSPVLPSPTLMAIGGQATLFAKSSRRNVRQPTSLQM